MTVLHGKWQRCGLLIKGLRAGKHRKMFEQEKRSDKGVSSK